MGYPFEASVPAGLAVAGVVPADRLPGARVSEALGMVVALVGKRDA